MAADQKQASVSRRVIFKSRRGIYSALFMSDMGDLFQEYDGTTSAPTAFYPDFTQSPRTMRLTVSSAIAAGSVTPVSIEYTVAGTKLVFNAAGACTTTGFTDKFKIVGGNLVIFGNLVTVAAGAGFNIQAKANMSATDSNAYIIVNAPVSIARHTAGSAGRLTIVPGDTKNFTIDQTGGSCILKAQLFKGGTWITPTTVKWEELVGTAWTTLSATGATLTVDDSMVNSYGIFRATVVDGSETYMDSQSVLDASDPLDITLVTKFAPSSTATATATSDLTLDDSMDATAYLSFTPTLVRRGETTAVGGTVTWNAAQLVNAAGVILKTVACSSGVYKLTEAMMASAGAGEYDFIISGSLA